MIRKGNVLAVMSPKGGVGKTVTTVNLALALANEFNKKILAIDTNVTTASLGFHFNLLYPHVTIYDVLKKNFSLTDAIHHFSDNLDIIPASIVIEEKDQDIGIMQKNVKKIVNHFDILLSMVVKQYDLILLDAAGGFNAESIATMQVADGLLLVTNPEYPAIVATAKAIEYAKLMEVPMCGIVLNKVRDKKYELKKEEIEDVLKINVIESIAFDNHVPEAIGKKMPLLLLHPHCAASVGFKRLAASIIDDNYNPNLQEKLRLLLRF